MIHPVLRVYFNRHGGRPWSVDMGTGTPESLFTDVVLSHASGLTTYRPLKDGENPTEVPCAWIEFHDHELIAGPNVAIIQ